MRIASLKAILSALDMAEVRYLVAGEVAVNVHGYQRLTHDLDLVVQLSDENTRRALQVLSELGYRPNVRVPIEEFADPRKRAEWTQSSPFADWRNASWEGCQRAQLRASLRLTARERFEALADTAETARWLASATKAGPESAAAGKQPALGHSFAIDAVRR